MSLIWICTNAALLRNTSGFSRSQYLRGLLGRAIPICIQFWVGFVTCVLLIFKMFFRHKSLPKRQQQKLPQLHRSVLKLCKQIDLLKTKWPNRRKSFLCFLFSCLIMLRQPRRRQFRLFLLWAAFLPLVVISHCLVTNKTIEDHHIKNIGKSLFLYF